MTTATENLQYFVEQVAPRIGDPFQSPTGGPAGLHAFRPDGLHWQMMNIRPNRFYEALSADGFVDLLQSLTLGKTYGGSEEGGLLESPRVLVSASLIKSVIRYDDVHKDIVRMKLTVTDHFSRVQELPASKFGHDELLSMLRLELTGCVPADFLAAVKAIRVDKLVQTEAELDKAEATVGRRIASKLRTEAPLPDMVTLTVPAVYNEFIPSEPVQIPCNVQVVIDCDGDVIFMIVPEPGILYKALCKALTGIGTEFKRALCDIGAPQVPVILGEVRE